MGQLIVVAILLFLVIEVALFLQCEGVRCFFDSSIDSLLIAIVVSILILIPNNYNGLLGAIKIFLGFLFSLFNINTTSYKIKDPKSEEQLNETSDLKNKIQEIDLLYKEGIITIDEYNEKRKQLIEKHQQNTF